MNVTCPNCATIYRIDPAKVPEAGVRARCAVCNAVFAVRREAEGARTVEPPKVEPPRAQPVKAEAPRPEPPRPKPAAPEPPSPQPVRAVQPPSEAPRPSAAPAVPAAPPQEVPSSRPAAPSRPANPFTRPTASPSSVPAASSAPAAPAAPAALARPTVPPAAQAPAPPTPRSPNPSSAQPAPRPTPPAGARPANPFLSQDPTLKARRLARALISDMVVYHPGKRQEGLRDGNLKELFEEEIKKSWEEYAEQVGRDVAESTTYFREALNEILAGGRQIF
jgi:predicted Zn finger-like uncharacterized protein